KSQDITQNIKKSQDITQNMNNKQDITQNMNNKVLIFSQSLHMLSVLEKYLTKKRIKHLRMDGKTPVEKRDQLVREFNNLKDENSVKVFLLSTRATGLGINLSKANKIIIVDPDWNPSVDNQAIDRACRIGQTAKHVDIVRLITAGSMEETIQAKQVYKEILCEHVLRQKETKKKDSKNIEKSSSDDENYKKRRKNSFTIKKLKNDFSTMSDLFQLVEYKLIENYKFEDELAEIFFEASSESENDGQEEEQLFINSISNNRLSSKEMIRFITDRESKFVT
ncbi:putative DNA excision repair protein ERCC-6, partial [Pseudoloma neurophilia]